MKVYLRKSDAIWILEHLNWNAERSILIECMKCIDTVKIPTYQMEYLDKDLVFSILEKNDWNMNREELLNRVNEIQPVKRTDILQWIK